MCTQRKDYEGAVSVDENLKAKGRGFRRNQPWRHLDLEFLASRAVKAV